MSTIGDGERIYVYIVDVEGVWIALVFSSWELRRRICKPIGMGREKSGDSPIPKNEGGIMSRITSLLLISFVLVQLNCNSSTESPEKDVYVKIDVESAFENDLVKVYLDSALLLDSSVTTNYTVDLAWSSGLCRLSGSSHTLLFSMVNEGLQKQFAIGLTDDTSTVVVRFDKGAKSIIFQQVKGTLLRD